MKLKMKVLGMAAGAALLGLQPATASAHTDVVVGIDIGIPVPVVVERRPVYYYYDDDYGYAPAVVHYHVVRDYPRHVACYKRHDYGRHRGHGYHKRHWRHDR